MQEYKLSVLKSNINSFLSFLFVGVFALGAVLVLCQVAFNENPIANAMSQYIVTETQLP